MKEDGCVLMDGKDGQGREHGGSGAQSVDDHS